jgi:hypothetical protein
LRIHAARQGWAYGGIGDYCPLHRPDRETLRTARAGATAAGKPAAQPGGVWLSEADAAKVAGRIYHRSTCANFIGEPCNCERDETVRLLGTGRPGSEGA